jgi:ubiquinone/menaquinone biosynthesis C-methylase UbiE
MQRIWNRVGSKWDENIKPDSADHTAPLAAACDRIEPEPRAILELGTGTGAGARMLARRFPAAKIVGVDLAETMIAAARANTPPDLTDRLSFSVADAASLAYPEATFDLVVHLNIPPFFIGVVARVLRPGGHVIVADSFGPATPSHVPEHTLQQSFGRRGLDVIATGQAEAGTFLIARRAASH